MDHEYSGTPKQLKSEADNMAAIKAMRDHHNDTCPLGPAIEVHMAPFDIGRMRWEEGDVIAGLLLVSNPNVQPGRMRVVCAGDKENDVSLNAIPVALPQPKHIEIPDVIPMEIIEPAYASGEVHLS